MTPDQQKLIEQARLYAEHDEYVVTRTYIRGLLEIIEQQTASVPDIPCAMDVIASSGHGTLLRYSETGKEVFESVGHSVVLLYKRAQPQQAASMPPAAEVFAAFDAALEADKRETWTGAYKDSTPAGRQRSREAWARVAELRNMITAAPEVPKS